MTQEELDFLTERKRAYQLAFGSPAGERVLKDLRRFCCDVGTTFRAGDAYESFALEGRRQVLLRIREHLEMDVGQLLDAYEKRGGELYG